jgi:hypothetical protein
MASPKGTATAAVDSTVASSAGGADLGVSDLVVQQCVQLGGLGGGGAEISRLDRPLFAELPNSAVRLALASLSEVLASRPSLLAESPGGPCVAQLRPDIRQDTGWPPLFRGEDVRLSADVGAHARGRRTASAELGDVVTTVSVEVADLKAVFVRLVGSQYTSLLQSLMEKSPRCLRCRGDSPGRSGDYGRALDVIYLRQDRGL